MKKVITGLLMVVIISCTVSTVQAFVLIHEGVKSLNGSEHLKSDSSVVGHRINPQGQFTLVYSK